MLVNSTLFLILGVCVGSFLNVVIDRIPAGKGLGGRSKADCCGRTLGVLDLVPVLSFLLGRGRCRYCGRKISFYYPLVEALTGILTVLAFLYFPLPYSVFYAVNFYFLIIFFFTDLKYGVVLVSIFLFNLIFLILSYAYLHFAHLLNPYFLLLTSVTAFGAALFIILLILITRGRGMGVGDVLLAFLFSLMVGFPASFVMIFLSFIFGGFLSAVLLILRRKRFGQTVPFGPFLAGAAVFSIFYGRTVFDWYLSTIQK